MKRYLRVQLKRLRGEIKRGHAAECIGKTVQQLGHFETGHSIPSKADLAALLAFYGAEDRIEFFERLRILAQKGKDWWIGFTPADLPGFDAFLATESLAMWIRSFDALAVPGLFQTDEYATALVRARDPDLENSDVARRVGLRLERQRQVLGRADAPHITRIIHEPVLHTLVGGESVMRAQLAMLLDSAARPNVDIQILRPRSGAHAGMDGSFTLMDYPPEYENDPGTVYVQTALQGVYYEEPADVDHFRSVFTQLQMQAESPTDSLDLIRQLAKELEP